MVRPTEKIEEKILGQTYEKLRKKGVEELEDCIKNKSESYETLEAIAFLSETEQHKLLYEAVGKARLEGHSWRSIAYAAKGDNDQKSYANFQRSYLSFCRNNDIEPVKMRRDN